MASTFAPSSSSMPSRAAAGYRSPAIAPSQPSGTFLPNTKVQVGSHRVIIEKYLSEGGFAHVYVVRVPRDNNKHELAVLKRVAVPDKDHLASMRIEVETMKKLKGHKHIVTYIDSHASQLQGSGFEVFMLMEYCAGGGLIDFMNTRLQHRLTEPEILKIFGDVSEGVATMHYLKPPLLHRDLKVENVLISKSKDGAPVYKVCDFGSAAPPRPAAKTPEEGRLIEEDVQKHTTMQYRSPEMIDVWRKQPIDEKADIWALGVLLYKLCYYTTPFEEVGQMAILNASFKYPAYPSFSDRIKKLVGWMLQEDPWKRPNIYLVIKEVYAMRGLPGKEPIKDIYAGRTQSESRRNEHLPSPDSGGATPPVVGLSKAQPQQQTQQIPDITPMRRGRPTAQAQAPAAVASIAKQKQVGVKPSPSPARGDPFAALDSKDYDVRVDAVDELSKKFPSLEEFSITQDNGGKFSFGGENSPLKPGFPNEDRTNLNARVTNALADEVFNAPQKPRSNVPNSQGYVAPQQQRRPSPTKPKPRVSVDSDAAKTDSLIQQPTPVRPGITYTSTGTNPSPPPEPRKLPEVSKRPIWRVPEPSHARSASQPRASEDAKAAAAYLQPSLPPSQRPALLDIHRSKSQTATQVARGAAKSSRPSLEGGRPSQTNLDDSSGVQGRATSAHVRQRPTSAYLSSNLDFLKDAESNRKRTSMELKRPSMDVRRLSRQPTGDKDEAIQLENDLEYLRSNEENQDTLHRSTSSKKGHHKKKSSISGSISGAKNLFAGRFGDAFKKFEGSGTSGKTESEREHQNLDPVPLLTPEPRDNDEEPMLLSPIAGSEATPSRKGDSDSISGLEVTEDLPPEVKRELERMRLSEEEKRVAAAAEQYRMRIGSGSGDAAIPTRARTIQTRVQNLLDEGRRSPIRKPTAEGYGHYTDAALQLREEAPVQEPPRPQSEQQPQRGETLPPRVSSLAAKAPMRPIEPRQPDRAASTSSAPPAPQENPQRRVVPRPSAPPKPKALRTGGQWPPPKSQEQNQDSASQLRSTGLQALLAKDLEGVPNYPNQELTSSVLDADLPSRLPERTALSGDNETDLDDFSKRYPSLSGIEMVETEIGGSSVVDRRVKEI